MQRLENVVVIGSAWGWTFTWETPWVNNAVKRRLRDSFTFLEAMVKKAQSMGLSFTSYWRWCSLCICCCPIEGSMVKAICVHSATRRLAGWGTDVGLSRRLQFQFFTKMFSVGEARVLCKTLEFYHSDINTTCRHGAHHHSAYSTQRHSIQSCTSCFIVSVRRRTTYWLYEHNG